MNIVTKFNIGDIVCPISEANKGKLITSIVEKITIKVETTDIIVKTYQLSNTELFHNSIYNENEIDTVSVCRDLVETYLNEQIEQLQNQINDLNN